MKRVKNLFGLFTNCLSFSRLFKYKIAFMFLLKYEGASGNSRDNSYTEQKILEYFNSAFNKLVLNFLKLQFIVNIKFLTRVRSFKGKS